MELHKERGRDNDLFRLECNAPLRLVPEACDASPNLRELTVYFNKHIAAYKLLFSEEKRVTV